MKKIIIFILIFNTLFFCKKKEADITKVEKIDSVWEYSEGEPDSMSFIFFTDGYFIYNLTKDIKYQGQWQYDEHLNQIILIISKDNKNIKFWDERIFNVSEFISMFDKYIGEFDIEKRKVGFIIKYASDDSEYINFLGYNFYKK